MGLFGVEEWRGLGERTGRDREVVRMKLGVGRGWQWKCMGGIEFTSLATGSIAATWSEVFCFLGG